MYHSCLIHTLLIIIVSCSTSTSHHHQLISPPSDLRYPQSCHLILLKQPVILHGILQQVRGRASQPRLPASRFFTTGRSCRWSPTKTWLLWLGEIWQISLSNFGRSSSWFKTHIPKTKVITLNTSTFFFEKRHLFVLSSSAKPPILPLLITDPKRWEMMRCICQWLCLKVRWGPTKPVRSKRSMLVKPMKISWNSDGYWGASTLTTHPSVLCFSAFKALRLKAWQMQNHGRFIQLILPGMVTTTTCHFPWEVCHSAIANELTRI